MSEQDIKNADFRIRHDGVWEHNGAEIKREALAKLFGMRALKIDEQGAYWLQTPFEKYPIIVEDVPFIIVDYTVDNAVITLRTNLDETVNICEDHPLELRADKTSGDVLPYIHVRGGLYARLGRNVYYALIEQYGAEVMSSGKAYPLGVIEE